MKHPWRGCLRRGTREKFGEVAERSIAADCKSAGLVPTEVRTLPSPPLFLRRRRCEESGRREEEWWGGNPRMFAGGASPFPRDESGRVIAPHGGLVNGSG